MLGMEINAPHITSAANVIKETMDYYHVTQKDLASRLNVSQKYISDILNRKEYINANMAMSIQFVMGISSKLLLNLDMNYRLHNAKAEFNHSNKPKMLNKFSWAAKINS